MTAGAWVAAPIGTILRLLKAQLVSVTGLDPSRVHITARDANQMPHDSGDRDLIIRPMYERPTPGMLEGGGRKNDRRFREVQIIPRSRAYLDPVDSDEVRLTDGTLGLLALEDMVVDALEMFQVTQTVQATGAVNTLTFPIFVEGPTAPEPDRDDENWVHSTFTLQIQYQRLLDQTWQ